MTSNYEMYLKEYNLYKVYMEGFNFYWNHKAWWNTKQWKKQADFHYMKAIEYSLK